MTVASIPVDLLNPGQVFACLGFMELAEVLLGHVRAGFDWSDPSQVRFLVDAAGEADPFDSALGFLAEAEVYSATPPGSDLGTEKWNVPSREAAPRGQFPVPTPASPASLPAILRLGDTSVSLHSWGEVNAPDTLGTHRDNVKFWAGAGGYPGVGLLRDALAALRPRLTGARPDPFNVGAPQSSSFRFDWRRDYIPLDIGFSLNEHGKGFQPQGYPIVEVLAAVGLAHARPRRGKNKLDYTYGVAGRAHLAQAQGDALLPPPLLRAALGHVELPFPTRTFTMHLGWPGQEGQARCITHVFEETTQ